MDGTFHVHSRTTAKAIGQMNLSGRVPAAAKFSSEWQVTVWEARILLDGAEQRHNAAETRQQEANRVDRAVETAQDDL